MQINNPDLTNALKAFLKFGQGYWDVFQIDIRDRPPPSILTNLLIGLFQSMDILQNLITSWPYV